MSVLEEVRLETSDPTATAAAAEREVLRQNHLAMGVDTDALDAFLELLQAADDDYLDTGNYRPAPAEPLLDWDEIRQALDESQRILIGVQNLLSDILAGMGVEDHQFLRVYADPRGDLRLVSDHPRRTEIEAVLNGPDHHELRSLYQASTAGMSLAGSLVGTLPPPETVPATGSRCTSAA
ncbi:MAG: hypothetical protein LIP77_06890 [Planctomycetes bacterium]|nr:hypothetical protein [Planctomycetota bacterium]